MDISSTSFRDLKSKTRKRAWLGMHQPAKQGKQTRSRLTSKMSTAKDI
jgi:hypothetical protein